MSSVLPSVGGAAVQGLEFQHGRGCGQSSAHLLGLVSNREQPRLTTAGRSAPLWPDRCRYKPCRCPVTYTGKPQSVYQWCEEWKKDGGNARARQSSAHHAAAALFVVCLRTATLCCVFSHLSRSKFTRGKIRPTFLIQSDVTAAWGGSVTNGWIRSAPQLSRNEKFLHVILDKLAAKLTRSAKQRWACARARVCAQTGGSCWQVIY